MTIADAKTTHLGMDAFLGDLIGFNFQGLRTVTKSFTDPKAIAIAACDRDWLDTYTPTFRTWFILFAFGFLFQFLWAGPDTAYTEGMRSQMEKALITLPDFDPATFDLDAFTSRYVSLYFGAAALFSAASYLLLSTFWRVTESKVGYVLRQRLIFLTLLPSGAISFLLYLPLGFVSPDVLPFYLLGIGILSSLLTGITAYRGVYRWGSKPARFARTLGLVVGQFIAIILAAGIVQIGIVAIITPQFLG